MQVPQTLSSFLTQIQNQYQKKVKIILIDNGREFIGQECQFVFKKNGILLHKTCVYTPQQIGVVERKHKHLLQVARSLMFQPKMPKKFWGDSILGATYIINRLPSAVIEGKTPFEMLNGHKPDYTRLKIFGCLCFATNTQPHKDKFAERALECVFIGYIKGEKAYKVYDLNTHKIHVSRDVQFYENVYPFDKPTAVTYTTATPLPLLPITSDSIELDVNKSLANTSLFFDANTTHDNLQDINDKSPVPSTPLNTLTSSPIQSSSSISTTNHTPSLSNNLSVIQSPPPLPRVSTRPKK